MSGPQSNVFSHLVNSWMTVSSDKASAIACCNSFSACLLVTVVCPCSDPSRRAFGGHGLGQQPVLHPLPETDPLQAVLCRDISV